MGQHAVGVQGGCAHGSSLRFLQPRSRLFVTGLEFFIVEGCGKSWPRRNRDRAFDGERLMAICDAEGVLGNPSFHYFGNVGIAVCD